MGCMEWIPIQCQGFSSFFFRQHLSVMHLKISNSNIAFSFLKTLGLIACSPSHNIMRKSFPGRGVIWILTAAVVAGLFSNKNEPSHINEQSLLSCCKKNKALATAIKKSHQYLKWTIKFFKQVRERQLHICPLFTGSIVRWYWCLFISHLGLNWNWAGPRILASIWWVRRVSLTDLSITMLRKERFAHQLETDLFWHLAESLAADTSCTPSTQERLHNPFHEPLSERSATPAEQGS